MVGPLGLGVGNTYIHTYIHTCIHTCMHTYIYTHHAVVGPLGLGVGKDQGRAEKGPLVVRADVGEI